MKLFKNLKTAAIATTLALGATLANAASSFDGVNSNGQSIGKVSKNVAQGFVDGTSALEAFLYLGGIFFVVMCIMTLVKWKKSEGRDGSVSMICVYLLAAVLCIGAPTLLGGGLSTIWGSGSVQTVKAPTANMVGN